MRWACYFTLCSRSVLCFPFVPVSGFPVQEPRSEDLHTVIGEARLVVRHPTPAPAPHGSGFVLDINYGLFHQEANAFSKRADHAPMF